MRKFTKVCLIVSLSLIIIGGTLCIIGTVTGGWRLAEEVGKDNSLVRFAWTVPESYGWKHWGDVEEPDAAVTEIQPERSHDDMAETHNGHSSSYGDASQGYGDAARDYVDASQNYGDTVRDYVGVARDYEDTGIRAADVKELKIEIGGAALYLREAEDDCFGVKTEGKGEYHSYKKSGTFYLEGNLDSWKQYGGSTEERVYLYLPKGMVFREADIEVGGGLLEISILSADEIGLSVGAGKMIAGELVCNDLKVETGAGEAVLKQVTAQELDVETGLGNTYIKGSIGRKIDVECGMGNTELVLSGSESDFNYEISCAIGNVKVGSRSYSALADDTYIDNGAAGECSLECAMGEISITFSD